MFMRTLIIILFASTFFDDSSKGTFGDVPNESSDEMRIVEKPRGLNLIGCWEVMISSSYPQISDPFPVLVMKSKDIIRYFKIQDEGNGNLRLSLDGDKLSCLGIYRVEDKQVVICLSLFNDDRPKTFQTGDTKCFLILQRPKTTDEKKKGLGEKGKGKQEKRKGDSEKKEKGKGKKRDIQDSAVKSNVFSWQSRATHHGERNRPGQSAP